MRKLIHALAEEIGDPDLFVGRQSEMARLLKWAEDTKRRRSRSMGIFSRRKKGKTALIQRFFNILYNASLREDDSQLIPFYYRILEERVTKTVFAKGFYRRLLSQYFAFTTRTPDLVARILTFDELRELAASDRHVADDIRAMEDILESSPGEAWGYARDAGHRISQLNDVRIIQILDEFQYMNKWISADQDLGEDAELCYSYMGTAESKYSPQIVAGSYIGRLGAILSHMTGRYEEWELESLSDAEALEAVYNYAAAYEVAITDETAPYIAEVCGLFRFRGLGDHVFAMVFRRLYGDELEDMSPGEIEDDFKDQLRSLRGEAARYKGSAAEYRVLYRLSLAAGRGATLADIVQADIVKGSVEDDVPLGPFTTLRKARFFIDQDRSYEIDIHAVSAAADGTDLMVEVKDLEHTASMDAVRRFLEAKEALSPQLERETVFLFYSESGVNAKVTAALAEAGVLVIAPKKLATFEATGGGLRTR